MGHNLLNAASMALCVRDLGYSVFCLACTIAQIWLDVILPYT